MASGTTDDVIRVCTITKACQAVHGRHLDDEGKEIVDKGVERLYAALGAHTTSAQTSLALYVSMRHGRWATDFIL